MIPHARIACVQTPNPTCAAINLLLIFMTDPEQINAFASDLKRLIDIYRAEFDLTLAAAIGTLEIIKLELFDEQKEDHE